MTIQNSKENEVYKKISIVKSIDNFVENILENTCPHDSSDFFDFVKKSMKKMELKREDVDRYIRTTFEFCGYSSKSQKFVVFGEKGEDFIGSFYGFAKIDKIEFQNEFSIFSWYFLFSSCICNQSCFFIFTTNYSM